MIQQIKEKSGTVVAVVVGLVGLVVIGISAWRIYRLYHTIKYTEATITAASCVQSTYNRTAKAGGGTGVTTECKCSLSFVDEKGARHVCALKRTRATVVGDRIKIGYDPANPEATVRENYSAVLWWILIGVMVFMLVGFIFSMVMVRKMEHKEIR